MKRLLLVVMLLLSATSCSFVENVLDKFDIEIGKPKTERRRVTRTPRVVNRVYSYAYEGHLNIRETPSFNARIIGKFRNGPEGGNLLQDLGGWSQVEVNGVVGYVVSRYLKRTPTIPYTGRVGLSWIEGCWWQFYGYCIFNNGYWEKGYNAAFEMGYYIMQNNEVKLVTVCYKPDAYKEEWVKADPNDPNNITILKIDECARTLGGGSKMTFVPRDDEYDDYPFIHSLADFREHGKYVAKKVSAYMSK